MAARAADEWRKKLDAFQAEPPQFREAQPECRGGGIEVPAGPAGRRKWLERRPGPDLAVQGIIEKWCGSAQAKPARRAEVSEFYEYGRRPGEAEIMRPFLFFELEPIQDIIIKKCFNS